MTAFSLVVSLLHSSRKSGSILLANLPLNSQSQCRESSSFSVKFQPSFSDMYLSISAMSHIKKPVHADTIALSLVVISSLSSFHHGQKQHSKVPPTSTTIIPSKIQPSYLVGCQSLEAQSEVATPAAAQTTAAVVAIDISSPPVNQLFGYSQDFRHQKPSSQRPYCPMHKADYACSYPQARLHNAYQQMSQRIHRFCPFLFLLYLVESELQSWPTRTSVKLQSLQLLCSSFPAEQTSSRTSALKSPFHSLDSSSILLSTRLSKTSLLIISIL